MRPSSTALSSLSDLDKHLAQAVAVGIMAGRQVIALVNEPGVDCTPVIRAIADALELHPARIVRVGEDALWRGGPAISAMDQISESAEQAAEEPKPVEVAADRVALINRALKMLTCNPSGEKRRLLIVELAHLFNPETLDQLARLTAIGPPELRMQLLLVGQAVFWHQLQAAKFEETRQRIGVPYLMLASAGSGIPCPATAPAPSRRRGAREDRRTGRRRLALACLVLLAGGLSAGAWYGSSSELGARLIGQLSTVAAGWGGQGSPAPGAASALEPKLPEVAAVALTSGPLPEGGSVARGGPTEATNDAGRNPAAIVDTAKPPRDLPAVPRTAELNAIPGQEAVTNGTSSKSVGGEANVVTNTQSFGADAGVGPPTSVTVASAQAPATVQPVSPSTDPPIGRDGLSGPPYGPGSQRPTPGQLALVYVARDLFKLPASAGALPSGEREQPYPAAVPDRRSAVAASRPEPEPAAGPGRASEAPVVPVVALVANSASTQASREALTQRGDQTLALGDVSAARLLYARAAALGSSQATMSMGRTFDPEFLSAMRARMPADPSIAAEWYRKAIALGSTEATPMLARLQEHGPR